LAQAVFHQMFQKTDMTYTFGLRLTYYNITVGTQLLADKV